MARIARVLAGARIEADAEVLLNAASGEGVLTLNFHPDRLLADGRSVAQALYGEGVYRSQFETSISGGGLTAYPGGARDVWERALFAGAYQAPRVRACERPKYGGLNLMNYLNGACPGFGSCHVRLRRAATERATLIFGDSSAKPTDIGLIDAFAPVMAPLLESIAAGGGALGRNGVDVRAFVDGVLRGDISRWRGLFASAMGHTLSDYIEAQVPQDAPDAAGAELMRWQAFCTGGRARRLAQRVIERHGMGARLDAANIGQAAVSVVRNPERWQDWGAPREVLQHLKDLWVIVVAHGEPLP